jgi:hypothetical protein
MNMNPTHSTCALFPEAIKKSGNLRLVEAEFMEIFMAEVNSAFEFWQIVPVKDRIGESPTSCESDIAAHGPAHSCVDKPRARWVEEHGQLKILWELGPVR